MSVNLLPATPAIKDWLDEAVRRLTEIGIEQPRLDAEIILAHTLRCPRTYLHAHPDEIIDSRSRETADARLDLRLDRMPIAYIIGYKEFYRRKFKVTPATLIPRPESEILIDLLKDILDKKPFTNRNDIRLVDVGTGTGCLGITAKLLFGDRLDVTLIDSSAAALKIASINAKKHRVKVNILQSDLLESYPLEPDIILANLPYVDKSWPRSLETKHEPAESLFAIDDGMSIIKRLIAQSSSLLQPKSYLIIEADPEQHDDLIEHADTHSFKKVDEQHYGLVFSKI